VRKAVLRWLCAGLVCAAGVAWGGEAAAPDVDALKKQLAELKQKEDAVRAKRDALRAELRKAPDLAALHEASKKAEAAYAEKKAGDEAYVAATKARDEAEQAFAKLVKEKLAANDDAKRVQAELDASKDDTPEAKKARAEARAKLDEIRHAIEKGDDADVKAASEKRDAARKARDEAGQAEAISAARKARDEAREAYDTKARELEKANPDLAAAIKEREDIREQVHELEKKIKEAEAPQK